MNRNFKTEFFKENGQTFMKLEFDEYKVTGEMFHVTIPKICMENISLKKEDFGYIHTPLIQLNVYPVNDNELMFKKDITPCKLMTVKEIERELGYKIKIVGE